MNFLNGLSSLLISDSCFETRFNCISVCFLYREALKAFYNSKKGFKRNFWFLVICLDFGKWFKPRIFQCPLHSPVFLFFFSFSIQIFFNNFIHFFVLFTLFFHSEIALFLIFPHSSLLNFIPLFLKFSFLFSLFSHSFIL